MENDENFQTDLSKQVGNGQNESTICECCSDIFAQKQTIAILATKKGLQFKRTRHSMQSSALDGCVMCRDLLCIPYSCRSSITEARHYQRRTVSEHEPKWPLDWWRESVSSKPRLPAFIIPKLRFTIQGDITKKTYFTVSCSDIPESLDFEVASEYGMIFRIHHLSLY